MHEWMNDKRTFHIIRRGESPTKRYEGWTEVKNDKNEIQQRMRWSAKQKLLEIALRK